MSDSSDDSSDDSEESTPRPSTLFSFPVLPKIDGGERRTAVSEEIIRERTVANIDRNSERTEIPTIINPLQVLPGIERTTANSANSSLGYYKVDFPDHKPIVLLDNKDNCHLQQLSTDELLQLIWYNDAIEEPCYVTIQPLSKYDSYTPFCMEIKAKNIPCEGSRPLITYKTRLDNYRFHEGTVPCTANIEQERCFTKKTSLTVIFSSMVPKPETSSFSVRFYTHRTNTVDNNGCSYGWEVFGGHCYYFGRDQKNWTGAKEFCEKSDSNLARIETPEENEWLYNHREKEDMWTGGIRSFYDDFIWYDNREDMLYTNWNFMEPSNRYDNEDCMLLLITNSGRWNDRKCSTEAEFICEKSISKKK